MSRSSEAFASASYGTHGTHGAPGSRTGGRAWRDAGPGARRCPVCGGDSWCQVYAGDATTGPGDVVLCKRVESERERTNAEGWTFWVHYRNGASPATFRVAHAPTARRASPETLDTAYAAALDALDLATPERDGLLARGLSRGAIRAAGYRSIEVRGRARVARAIAAAVGDDEALAVPGVYVAEGDRGEYLSFAGAVGLVIPCRSADGRIHALKVRARDAGDHQRYTFVSSAKRGGPSAVSALHVPVAAQERLTDARACTLVITEGPLKADVATHLSAHAVVAVPGVGQWQLAVDLVTELGPNAPARVVVAFDMDRLDKPEVARACAALVLALRRVHPRVALWQWDPAHKGIDDHYLAARLAQPASEQTEQTEQQTEQKGAAA